MKTKILIPLLFAGCISLLLSPPTFSNGLAHYETFNFEAENGVLTAPMKAYYDSTASGDLFIDSENPNQVGKADFYFTAKTTATFVVYARVLSIDPSHDSFLVAMDTGTEDVYDTSEGSWGPNWQWTKMGGRNGTGTANTIFPRSFNLTPGLHALHFKAREIGTKLDKVMVTSYVNVSTLTLSAYQLYHPCPVLPSGSPLCIDNIIRYQIKPVYESTILTDLEKCRKINDILRRKLDPLLAEDNANFIQNYEAGCGTCSFRESESGCPWEVAASSP